MTYTLHQLIMHQPDMLDGLLSQIHAPINGMYCFGEGFDAYHPTPPCSMFVNCDDYCIQPYDIGFFIYSDCDDGVGSGEACYYNYFSLNCAPDLLWDRFYNR